MPKRLSRSSSGDPNRAAFKIVEQIAARTETPPKPKKVVPITKRKNPAAVALGRLGGKKSAQGRMEKISQEDRRRYAMDAARARWEKEKGDS